MYNCTWTPEQRRLDLTFNFRHRTGLVLVPLTHGVGALPNQSQICFTAELYTMYINKCTEKVELCKCVFRDNKINFFSFPVNTVNWPQIRTARSMSDWKSLCIEDSWEQLTHRSHYHPNKLSSYCQTIHHAGRSFVVVSVDLPLKEDQQNKLSWDLLW